MEALFIVSFYCVWAAASYLLTQAAIYMHIRCIWPIFIILRLLCLPCVIKSRRWTAPLMHSYRWRSWRCPFVRECNKQMMLRLTRTASEAYLWSPHGRQTYEIFYEALGTASLVSPAVCCRLSFCGCRRHRFLCELSARDLDRAATLSSHSSDGAFKSRCGTTRWTLRNSQICKCCSKINCAVNFV